MKKQYVSLLAIILSVSGFLFSCHDKMNKNTGALQFDSIQVNETAHLFNDTAKPACNIIINFAYPVKSSDDMLKDSLNSYFISACFGDKYIGEKPEEVVKQYTENYISEYRRDLEPMYAEDEKDKEDESSIGAWYSYYKGIESHVQLYDKDLLVYRIDYNEYTGGAHGIYMATSCLKALIRSRDGVTHFAHVKLLFQFTRSRPNIHVHQLPAPDVNCASRIDSFVLRIFASVPAAFIPNKSLKSSTRSKPSAFTSSQY